MALHPDAQKALELGIWNGGNQDQPATREVAAIMAWRAHDKAVAAADQALTAAVSALAERVNTPPDDGPVRTLTVRPGESVTVTGRP